MARRKQPERNPSAQRSTYIVSHNDPVIAAKAAGTQAQRLARCSICGREVEADTLSAHELHVHKPNTPDVRLKEILRDPDFARLRSHAYSPASCQVDVADWQSLCAFKQEVGWFAECHASRLEPGILAELQRVLRFIGRSFDDGWLKICKPSDKSAPERARSKPDTVPALGDGAGDKPVRPRSKRRKHKQKRQWIHVVGGGLPGSAR